MTPPAEDLPRRRPVWEALSAVFLDTQIDDAWRAHIAATLRSSGYSLPELEHILWRELCPALHTNLLSMAGEWSGFDPAHLEHQILSHPAGPLRQWTSYLLAGHLARHDWRTIKQALAAPPAT